MQDIASRTKPIFEAGEPVKLAYLFGSRARSDAGPLSDFDFAVYIAGPDPGEALDLELTLQDQLRRALGTDHVDLVALNRVQSLELKYHIIAEGVLLHEVEPFRLLVEPRILNEYFDFRSLLRRHGLTQA